MFQPVGARRPQRLPSLLAGVVAISVWVAAVPLARGAADDKAIAKAHYEAATRLYDVHEYGDALKEYKAGYLTRPDPSFLFNIGQCYKRLGMPDQAREFFREYLKKAAPDDKNRAQAEARIRELDNLEAANSAARTASSAEPPSAFAAPDRTSAGKRTAAQASEKLPAPPFSAAPAIPAGVDPAGVDLSASSATVPEKSEGAFYKTWWFWSGVGAVVVAGTVTAVLLLRGANDSPNVSGMTLGTRTVWQ
jgi:tetratricopeptide (TPR) repeat protein